MAQELKASCITTRSYNTCFCYNKSEVDAVLADKDAEIRRLKRALWVAREWRAWCEVQFWFVNPSNTQRDVYHLACTNRIHRTPVEWMAYWQKVEHLCRQKAQAEDDCAYWKARAQKNAADNAVMTKQRAEALKRERRQKYKRCLAMANWCYTNVHCIMGHRLCALSVRKKEWFDRWHERWLEIAEKFKPNNTTAQQGKG